MDEHFEHIRLKIRGAAANHWHRDMANVPLDEWLLVAWTPEDEQPDPAYAIAKRTPDGWFDGYGTIPTELVFAWASFNAPEAV